MSSEETGIDFLNDLPYTEEFNTYTYRNFYNGGGVALGDINNDGLTDIFFTGNIVNNKLYLNKGDWKFEDITEKAGVACPDVWCTGASMVDINGDGLLDIYVCKAGKPGGEKRYNELFINQGNLTFTEEAKSYGIDVNGLSIHSAFFDYDLDGDLDCYLLNNSIRAVGGFDLKEGLRNIPDSEGNKFFRNDDGKFIDATTEVGIYSSNIGYGLGITLSDFNEDQWPDIFISNDFFERDYLYLNNQDGTFREVGDQNFSSMSMGSMGADACDLDNDLKPDLFVTEMLPNSLERRKTKAVYETWNKYEASVKQGYHHQFSRNILQRNMGDGKFIELGRYAGVAATEWSWASLIQDFDNDGLKDLFISNGVYKDLLDKDYLNFSANDVVAKNREGDKKNFITALVDSMPSVPVQNFLYKNIGDFKFENIAATAGLEELTFSNGSAYADLDNDGDLDLVVNNANMPSFVFQNQTDTATRRFIQFELKSDTKNSKAIGAKVIIKYKGGQAMYEHFTSKGFESTVDGKIHFGVDDIQKIDSVIVRWPNGSTTVKTNLKTNKKYSLKESSKEEDLGKNIAGDQSVNTSQNISFEHEDVSINLFAKERLLLEMNGFRGPKVTSADVNKDGLVDLFFGGGKNQTSELYLNRLDGSFEKVNQPFKAFNRSEIVGAEFFDADNDGDLDLYLAHGGRSFSPYSNLMQDVILLNDGRGNFSEQTPLLNFGKPINTGDVAIGDLNNDGQQDLVVTEMMNNQGFGKLGQCFIFINQGNNEFKSIAADYLKEVGMLSSVALIDQNDDGYLDIVLAGKWMPITIIENQAGDFVAPRKLYELENSKGLWNTLELVDVDQDGDQDLIAGNEGLNNFYNTNLTLFINDFDQNGSAEPIFCYEQNGAFYPALDFDVLFSQIPFLKKRHTYYRDFAKATMTELFGPQAMKDAGRFDLEELKSMVFLNESGHFKGIALPDEIQYSSVYSISPGDTGQLYFGGNNFKTKPQFGRADGSFGWVLNFDHNSTEILFKQCNPLYISGQIRSIEPYGDKIIFGVNNEKIRVIDKQ